MLFVSNAGFERAEYINATVQMPRLTLHLSLNVLPGGKITWTGYGESMIRTATYGGGQGSHLAE